MAAKPSGCVVWIRYEEESESNRLKLSYLWFGGGPGEPLPHLGEQVGAHTVKKTPRPNTRVIAKRQFQTISSTKDLVEVLFGPVA